MNGSKLIKRTNKVVACLLTILLLATPFEESLFCKEIKAAEIGMVGALPGSVTVWEIFQTMFAASGIIIANDNIQNAASLNLGSSAYTLEEMERLGFIKIPTDGSNALDWDWSGLEGELENSATNDTKIIKGVFDQNGGSGQGGGNEDPWYKKAVNWVKAAVKNGYIKTSQFIEGETGRVTMEVGALASMLGNALSNNVTFGLPVTENTEFLSNTEGYNLSGIVNFSYSNNSVGVGSVENSEECVYFCYTRYISPYYYASYYYKKVDGTSGIVNHKITLYKNGVIDNSVNNTQSPYTVVTVSRKPEMHFKNAKYYNSQQEAQQAMQNYDADTFEPDLIKSPDVMTPVGNAVVPTGQPAWVPTPYINPSTNLEIIPQPKIDEFIQYVIEEVPEPGAAGEAWIDTVNPYTGIEPTPYPTQRPQPTQIPDITKIPDADPGGQDNPVNVKNPDPMPEIEGGFATTYGLMDFFPFCIPSDIVMIYKLFETEEDERAAPYIDWNIKIDRFGIDEHIVLDFSIFDNSAEVCRVLMFITFCFGLLLVTKQIIWS